MGPKSVSCPRNIQAADVHLEGTHFDVFIEVDAVLDVGHCHLPAWQRVVFTRNYSYDCLTPALNAAFRLKMISESRASIKVLRSLPGAAPRKSGSLINAVNLTNRRHDGVMPMNDAPNVNEVEFSLLLIYFFNIGIPIRFPAPIIQQPFREPPGHHSL